MKAYCVYPGSNPYDEGCVLVFANTRNQARALAFMKGPWWADYLEIKAIRVPQMDLFSTGEKPLIESNDELPKEAPSFFKECDR